MSKTNKAAHTRFVVATALFSAAVISTLALTALGNRTESYWVARSALIPGVQISESDLGQVNIALGEVNGQYLSRDALVAGAYVVRAIQKGELIAIGSVSDIPADIKSEQVPISVRSSDLPSDIELGESIKIYWVPEATGMEKVGSPELVISSAYLNSINRKSGNFGGEISLTVSVQNGEIFSLLSATASGRLVIVRANG